jgi:hypothetical protein
MDQFYTFHNKSISAFGFNEIYFAKYPFIVCV